MSSDSTVTKRRNVLDAVADALGLNGDRFPDDPRKQLDWLSDRETPTDEDRAKVYGILSTARAESLDRVYRTWADIHRAELRHGRSCIDFAERYGVEGGYMIDIDLQRVVDEYVLSAEEEQLVAEQHKIQMQIDARRDLVRRQADHRREIGEQKVKLSQLRTLKDEVIAYRSEMLASLPLLFAPDNIRESIHPRRFLAIYTDLAACDLFLKDFDARYKVAEGAFKVFEKATPR